MFVYAIIIFFQIQRKHFFKTWTYAMCMSYVTIFVRQLAKFSSFDIRTELKWWFFPNVNSIIHLLLKVKQIIQWVLLFSYIPTHWSIMKNMQIVLRFKVGPFPSSSWPLWAVSWVKVGGTLPLSQQPWLGDVSLWVHHCEWTYSDKA